MREVGRRRGGVHPSATPAVMMCLHAGLGNQLFQFAAAHTVQKSVSGTLCFASLRPDVTAQLQALLRVEMVPATRAQRRVFGLTSNATSLLARGGEAAWRRASRALGHSVVIHQTELNPDREMELPDVGRVRMIVMHGLFQHASWIEPALTEVSSRLAASLREVPLDGDDPAGVVSFRRGDYLPLGWALPATYYSRALEHVSDRSGRWVVVADDDVVAESAAALLREQGFDAAAPRPSPTPAIRDLALLSRARTVVMSNSTFCWWGVAAGGDSERTLIAPDPWTPRFGAGIHRPSWTRIDPAWPTARLDEQD